MISVYAYHNWFVRFCSCLCKVWSCVSEALLLALLTLIQTNNSSSDCKAFLHFIAFSGSPTAVHRPLHALRYYTVGIPFWIARKNSHRRLSSTEKQQYRVNWSHITVTYVLQRNTRKHCTWRKWLTYWVAVMQVYNASTFELSSFRKNGFLILLHFPRCSCWYLSLDA